MSEPFLKWAGGKRWLVFQRPELLRVDAQRHLEPFLGSGAVFFHGPPRRAILSDLNRDLIETYEVLRDAPLEVWDHLRRHNREHSEDYYYRIRSMNCRTPITRAARFIYLNRTCFNGLYRVNLKGEFNVPKGTKNTVLFESDDFEATAAELGQADLRACDFSETICEAEENDFLYIDPPYTVQHNTNNFVKYNEQIFSWSDQQRLARDLLEAASRGASILVSNADHPCIHKLYSAACWQRITVTRYSKIASCRERRNMTTELLISNYLNDAGEQVAPRR